MPVRIFDISKKLGLENKEILAQAKAMGIAAAKVPSSSLDRITADWLEGELIKIHPEAAARLAPKPPKPAPVEEKIVLIAAPKFAPIEQFKDKIKGDLLVIDSNIWMKADYEPLFEVLLRLKQNCVIVGDQLDEITNKKNRTKFGTDENKCARLGIDRVEKLQEADLVEIPGVTFESNKGAMADPEILKYAASETEQKRFVTIVTDDKELRVRAKAILKKKAPQLHRVLKGSDLLEDAHQILGTLRISSC